MNDIRQVLIGICAALISVVIIVGSFSMVLTEAGMTVAVIPSPVSTQEPSSGNITLTTIPVITPEFTASPTPGVFTGQVALPNVQNALPTATATELVCEDSDWTPVKIEGGTFEEIAQYYNIPPEELLEKNGLPPTISLIAGFDLCVPPITQPQPTQLAPTQPSEQCGAPANWVIYRIHVGDTLYTIAKRTGVTVVELQSANCMGSATLIRAGDSLYVPFIPAVMPSQTPQPTRLILPTNTFESPSQPIDTPTVEPVYPPLPTNTPPLYPTSTPLPTIPLIPTNTPPAPPTLPPSSTPLPSISPTVGDVQPKP